jgi:lactoylglutathione lyase
MKFCWITINVNNMEESLKFYQEIVGLSINKRFNAGPGSEIAFLGDGETQLELIFNDTNKQVILGKDVSLGFEVKSVDDKMAFVKGKGLKVNGGPFEPNPHVRFFFVLDPNGLRIQFVENK